MGDSVWNVPKFALEADEIREEILEYIKIINSLNPCEKLNILNYVLKRRLSRSL